MKILLNNQKVILIYMERERESVHELIYYIKIKTFLILINYIKISSFLILGVRMVHLLSG